MNESFGNCSFRCGDINTLSELKIPVPFNELERLSVLRDTRVLDSNRNSVDFDRITSLAAKLFDVPICLVSLVDLDRQWFKSAVGLAAPETHRNLAFCAYTVLEDSPDVFVVLNATEDPRFKETALVTGPPHVVFYAGAALVVEGQKLGSLCLIDNKPKTSFSLDQKKVLLDLGALVSKALSWSRYTSIAALHQRQVMLSLTHNINTLSTGFNFQLEHLLEFCHGASVIQQQEAIKSLLVHMDSLREIVVKRISVILSVGSKLPSLCSSFNDVADSSAWGPVCDVLGTLRDMTSLCMLAYPNVPVTMDESAFANTIQSCFVDIFLLVALSVASEVLQSDSLGSISIDFSEFESSKMRNADLETAGIQAQERLGDVIFKLVVPSVSDLHITTNRTWLAFLSTVSGSLSIQPSVEGQGASCVLSIPCRLSSSNNAAALEIVDGSSKNISALRVIIVDDDVDGSRDLSNFLTSKLFCSVERASNGKIGKLFYAAAVNDGNPYDILLVDLLMPVMNGSDMMRSIIRAYGPIRGDVIAIAMIGVADQFDQFMQDCDFDPSSFGFSYVILKPVDSQFLEILVQELISKKASLKSSEASEVDDDIRRNSFDGEVPVTHRSNMLSMSLSAASKYVKWSFFEKKNISRKRKVSPDVS